MELQDVMQAASDHMRDEFELLATIQHRGSKGSAREEIVRRFLGDHLPTFLGIGSGEIISVDNRVSKQMDLVIYDASKCPKIYHSNSVQIFPNEGVYAVVQVKSRLDSEQLESSIDNIASAKNLPKTAYYDEAIPQSVGPLYGRQWPYFPTLGVIFAFDSIKLRTITENLIHFSDEKNLQIHEQVDLICVLNKGVVYNFIPDQKRAECRPEPSSVRAYAEIETALLYFYILLMQQLPQARMRPIRMAKYAKFRVELKLVS